MAFLALLWKKYICSQIYLCGWKKAVSVTKPLFFFLWFQRRVLVLQVMRPCYVICLFHLISVSFSFSFLIGDSILIFMFSRPNLFLAQSFFFTCYFFSSKSEVHLQAISLTRPTSFLFSRFIFFYFWTFRPCPFAQSPFFFNYYYSRICLFAFRPPFLPNLCFVFICDA